MHTVIDFDSLQKRKPNAGSLNWLDDYVFVLTRLTSILEHT